MSTASLTQALMLLRQSGYTWEVHSHEAGLRILICKGGRCESVVTASPWAARSIADVLVKMDDPALAISIDPATSYACAARRALFDAMRPFEAA